MASSTLADLPVGTLVKVMTDSGFWFRVEVDTTQAGVILNPISRKMVAADGMLSGFVSHKLIRR
jgi:hypothetical protein